jgi:hypothetical protein
MLMQDESLWSLHRGDNFFNSMPQFYVPFEELASLRAIDVLACVMRS